MPFAKLDHLVQIVLPLAVAAGSVACSGSTGKHNEETAAAKPPAASPEAGVTTNAATLPCNIHTTYMGMPLPGDSQCILPPDPTKGMQFHYGPSNYDDPNDVANFILMPGQELTDCVFFMAPNTTQVYFDEYHSRLRPGSHHMLLYIQNNVVMEGGPRACDQLLSRNLAGATTTTMDVMNMSAAPENAGMAEAIPPSQQVVMQMHVINTTSQPILREGWANVMFLDPSKVRIVSDPIFFIAGTAMSIGVGQTVLNQGTAVVPDNASPDFRLVGAIPHYHAHTTRFTVYATQSGVKTKILEQYGTLDVPGEPILVSYDSVTKNTTPDPTTQTPGGYSGEISLKPGDTIDWECEQTNDGKGANGQPITTPLQFTEQVYTGEMCNLFGIYAPTTGTPWYGGDAAKFAGVPAAGGTMPSSAGGTPSGN